MKKVPRRGRMSEPMKNLMKREIQVLRKPHITKKRVCKCSKGAN